MKEIFLKDWLTAHADYYIKTAIRHGCSKQSALWCLRATKRDFLLHYTGRKLRPTLLDILKEKTLIMRRSMEIVDEVMNELGLQYYTKRFIMKVKITDPQDFNFGKEFEGQRVSDVYVVTVRGKAKTYRADQVDVEYYDMQLADAIAEKLGANVGDTVIIKSLGDSGSHSGFWDHRGEHVISRILPDGFVEFDNGTASLLNPKVEKVEKGGGHGNG